MRKNRLTFPILSDPDLAVIRAYGVEHLGHDIAHPATFIVDRTRTLRFAYLGEGMADMPPVEKILEDTRRAAAGAP